MKLLLDTCALLALGEGTLPKRASKTLSAAEDAMVPAVVVWEIAIKVKTGKLRLPDSPLPWVEALCSRYALELERQAPDVTLLCKPCSQKIPSVWTSTNAIRKSLPITTVRRTELPSKKPSSSTTF